MPELAEDVEHAVAPHGGAERELRQRARLEASKTMAREAAARLAALHQAAPAELVDSIRKVHAGRRAISPQVAERLAARVTGPELTDREREVLEHLAEGKSNKQIAKALGIADGTVKVHVANILEKLGAQGRSEAVAIAVRRGLVRIN